MKSINDLKIIIDGYNKTPMIRNGNIGKQLMHEYYFQIWYKIYQELNLNNEIKVLEIAPGASVMIPRAVDKYSNGKGLFYASNMNKKLTFKLKSKLEKLRIKYEIIEDDAIKIKKYIKNDSIDIIGFNHAINDMFEYLAAKNNSIDTVSLDWEDNYKLMIQNLETVYKNNNLDKIIKNDFILTIKGLYDVLKPKCYMIFNNYVFKEQVDCGCSIDLYDSLINITKDWILSTDLDLKLIKLKDLNENKWLCFQKN